MEKKTQIMPLQKLKNYLTNFAKLSDYKRSRLWGLHREAGYADYKKEKSE